MQNKEQLVAVYGSLRKKHNHSLLAGSEYWEYITEPIYDMYSVAILD
jgi:gamma-glutamylcyclotransferase (GGCT)/AIG2-like uncharacterized protein YtfP